MLSVARKLGATIFLVWEDIKDVKIKIKGEICLLNLISAIQKWL